MPTRSVVNLNVKHKDKRLAQRVNPFFSDGESFEECRKGLLWEGRKRTYLFQRRNGRNRWIIGENVLRRNLSPVVVELNLAFDVSVTSATEFQMQLKIIEIKIKEDSETREKYA